jgi:hypothetical protein
MDVDRFLLNPTTGLEVYQFYTGKSRQLHMGSRVSNLQRVASVQHDLLERQEM